MDVKLSMPMEVLNYISGNEMLELGIHGLKYKFQCHRDMATSTIKQPLQIKTKQFWVTPVANQYVSPFTRLAEIPYDSELTKDSFISGTFGLTTSGVVVAWDNEIAYMTNSAAATRVDITYKVGGGNTKVLSSRMLRCAA